LRVFHAAPSIDLLIADQNMQGRSGIELALELKSCCPTLPVLMISGGILEPGQLDLVAQPGWSFLPKPFRLPELLSAVHSILAPGGPA